LSRLLFRRWLAEDHGFQAVAEHVPVTIGCEEPVDLAPEARQPGGEPGAVCRGQILVGEVEAGLHAGDQVEEPVDHLLQPAAQGAAELLVGGGQRPLAARPDQVRDRLGLAQVHPAVEKRALGEFSGFGRPAPPPAEVLQQELGDQRAAMGADLQEILSV